MKTLDIKYKVKPVLAAILTVALGLTLVTSTVKADEDDDSRIPRARASSGLDDDGVETGLVPIQIMPRRDQIKSVLDEGTETGPMTADMIATIEPWINNTRISLDDILDQIKSLPLSEQRQKLYQATQSIVEASVPKRTELFVRYILNRARKTVDVLDKYSNPNVAGVLSLEVSLLKASVIKAKKYYQNDVDLLRKISDAKSGEIVTSLAYAQFGINYANFLMRMDQSALSVKARYEIAINAISYLQWDLYKDSNKVAYAPAIGHLYGFLKSMPERAGGNNIKTMEHMHEIQKAFNRVKVILTEKQVNCQLED